MLPLIPTLEPSSSAVLPSEAMSSAVCVASVQPPPGLVYTYTAPCAAWPPTVRCGAPAVIVPLLTPTLEPSWSAGAPSEAVSSAVCVASVQPPPGLVYTYTAPCASFPPAARRGAPLAIVSPLTATDQPRASYWAPSEAVSSAVWVAFVQPPPGFVYTYTAPWSGLAPTVCCGEPTTIVSALIATLVPSWSAASAVGGGELGGLGRVDPAVGRLGVHVHRSVGGVDGADGAPAVIVGPLTPTLQPRLSFAAPSEAVSSAVWVASSSRRPAPRRRTPLPGRAGRRCN